MSRNDICYATHDISANSTRDTEVAGEGEIDFFGACAVSNWMCCNPSFSPATLSYDRSIQAIAMFFSAGEGAARHGAALCVSA
jgi:hypothetical protein